MRLRSLGYVGQNLALGLTTGRTLRLANLANEERLAATIAANLADLEAMLAWNVAHDVRLFRIASSLIPFASHADFRFDWRERFASSLERIAAFAAEHDLRLSMHPGQYTVLNAMKDHVVDEPRSAPGLARMNDGLRQCAVMAPCSQPTSGFQFAKMPSGLCCQTQTCSA